MQVPLRYALAIGVSCALVGGIAQSSRAQSPAPQTWITGRLAERVRLGDGLRTYRPSLHQLGVHYASGESDKTPIMNVHFHVDPTILRHYLDHLATLVDRSPVDAKPVITPGADRDAQEVPATVRPGHNGTNLMVRTAVDLISKTLKAAPEDRHIVLPVTVTRAAVTAKDLSGINGRIAFFVTRFDPYNVGRTSTVRHAVDIVNGTVLQPGQIFSLNKTVGPRDPAHGFEGKSDVFINGKMAIQYGGGMCQVATTLFNAAMIGDLKIVERHQHVRTIPYAPPGSDATVYYGQKDLRFQNDTGAPIYIANETTLFHDIVSIYGKMVPGRKVKIIQTYHQIAQRHVVGSIDRIVYEPDGTIQKGPYYFSNYVWTKALDYNQ